MSIDKDKKNNALEIELSQGEELSEETLEELSNGKGDDDE